MPPKRKKICVKYGLFFRPTVTYSKMPPKKPQKFISIMGRVVPEKDFIPAAACLVREKPKGHKRYYHYLYYRLGGRLRKRYIPKEKVAFTRKIIAGMRRRQGANKKLADDTAERVKEYLQEAWPAADPGKARDKKARGK